MFFKTVFGEIKKTISGSNRIDTSDIEIIDTKQDNTDLTILIVLLILILSGAAYFITSKK